MDERESAYYSKIMVDLKRAIGYGPSEVSIDNIEVYEDMVLLKYRGDTLGSMTRDTYEKIITQPREGIEKVEEDE